MPSGGYIHRLLLVAILTQPFAIACLWLAGSVPQSWRLPFYAIGIGGIAACVVAGAIGVYETRWWNRRFNPQPKEEWSWPRIRKQLLSATKLSDPFDPVFNQLMRSLAGLVLMGSFVLSIAGVFWWWSRDPHYTPQSALYSAVVFLIVANAPAVWLFARLQTKYARDLPPLLGPFLPICPQCGYDCRSSPARCPECGNDMTDNA